MKVVDGIPPLAYAPRSRAAIIKQQLSQAETTNVLCRPSK